MPIISKPQNYSLMKEFTRALIFSICMVCNMAMVVHAQDDCSPLLYTRAFTDGTEGDFTIFNETGTYCRWKANSYGAVINGYDSSDKESDWLISPAFALAGYESATLTFYHQLYKATDTTDVGQFVKLLATTVESSSITAWAQGNDGITDDITIELEWTELPISAYGLSEYKKVEVSIPASLLTDSVRFAFHYTSDPNDKTHAYYWEIKDFSVSATCADGATQTTVNPNLPVANSFYDFDGDGYKEAAYIKSYDGFYTTSNYANAFAATKRFDWSSDFFNVYYNLNYIEDINGDGIMDFTASNNAQNQYASMALSQSDGTFTKHDKCISATDMDINCDGRIDYIRLSSNGANPSLFINLRQADGFYVEQAMQLVTKEEYEAQFDPNAWGSTTVQEWNGLIGATVPNVGATFSGASLARAPRRNSPRKAQGIGQQVYAPTKVLDLNADGLMDLIDEANGTIYYNMGDGKWIYTATNGAVFTADFNGDGIQDFVFPGAKLQTAIYQGNGEFKVTTLYENIQVDDDIYCYDFDHDGDVDILVTFSAPRNNTGYAYTMFFRNDGKGNFTQLEEQDYGDNNLYFSNCQDINGDGYYDLLAFCGAYSCYKDDCSLERDSTNYVVWLQGKADMTFAEPQVLYTLAKEWNGWGNLSSVRINAEDLDNDGIMEIWVSGVSYIGNTLTIHKPVATANTAPTAPAKPSLSYSDGILTIHWGNGADTQTATADLTYALRVGTASGKQDILHAHANADGSRRNYLDGNMGKYHTYTLDLSSYPAGTIYVAVQAIDAQHLGSAWSEEAVIEHTALPVAFTLSSTTVGKGKTLTATFTPTTEGYTHLWTAQDGVCTPTGNSTVQITFSAAGDKIVTHTLTAPDGRTAQATQTVTVMPNGTDEAIELTSDQYNMLSGRYDGYEMNDYNFDGYLDITSSSDNVVYKGEADFAFTKAGGIWNTGLTIPTCFWFDWTHNGAADLLVASTGYYELGYYLPHNGTNNLTGKKTDDNIKKYSLNGNTDIYDYCKVDYNHNGYYDIPMIEYPLKDGIGSIYFLSYNGTNFVRQEKQYNIQTDDDRRRFNEVLQGYSSKTFYIDFDHDGFIDVAGIYANSNVSTYNTAYKGIVVFVNKGNFTFEQVFIPFAQEIASSATANYGDMQNVQLVDFNNDGYYDIFACRYADGAPYILWNNRNQSFSAPDLLPLGDLQAFYTNRYGFSNIYQFADLDNNGYVDIISLQPNAQMGENINNVYVHYMGESGVIQQGFLLTREITIDYPYLRNFAANGVALVVAGNDDYRYSISPSIYPITGIDNQRPSAPTGLRAVQTDEGLLIEWNAAQDDHTPATQMRYNLSVKRAGQSGNGAYLISPQNAGNANAAYMPDYHYIAATRFLIPQSEIAVGDYEICLQALDLQNKPSLFSDTITTHVASVSQMTAPTSVCLFDQATFTYTGTQQTATPEWDFDGGIIDSGSGYGPYQVHWTTAGTKTVRLTINAETTERMLYVEEYTSDYTLPTYYLNDATTTIDLPADATCTWYARYNGDADYAPISAFAGVIDIKGNSLTLHKPAGSEDLFLQLTLANNSGCETTLQQRMQVIEQDQLPQLTIVTPNAEGKNVLTWDAAAYAYLTDIRVYKETNQRNRFAELSTVAATAGTYTDNTSNASTKAERYCIAGVLPDGTLTPQSNPHQTLHLTINRGIQDNTWNLLWNNYIGAEVVSYNILRGTAADELTLLTTISSSNTSYTDLTPDDSKPYYAIEYIIGSPTDMPARRVVQRTQATLRGTSNVVNSTAARTIVYAERLSILSANGAYATTADKPSLFLYAEIFPTNTTYKTVHWEITDGIDLASIDDNGLLTANTPNKGGTLTVRATTTDGTTLSATRQIQIAAISGGSGDGDGDGDDEPTKDYTPTNLQSTVNGNQVNLSWTAKDTAPYYLLTITHTTTDQVVASGFVNSTAATCNINEAGEYEWCVVATDENYKVISTASCSTFTINATSVEDITVPQSTIQKVLRNEQVLILRNNKTYTILGTEL